MKKKYIIMVILEIQKAIDALKGKYIYVDYPKQVEIEKDGVKFVILWPH